MFAWTNKKELAIIPKSVLSMSCNSRDPHHNDVIMNAMASQITSVLIVYSTVCSGVDQSSASLAFVRGIHRWPVNCPHKGPVTWKIFLFDDVIMWMNLLDERTPAWRLQVPRNKDKTTESRFDTILDSRDKDSGNKLDFERAIFRHSSAHQRTGDKNWITLYKSNRMLVCNSTRGICKVLV